MIRGDVQTGRELPDPDISLEEETLLAELFKVWDQLDEEQRRISFLDHVGGNRVATLIHPGLPEWVMGADWSHLHHLRDAGLIRMVHPSRPQDPRAVVSLMPAGRRYLQDHLKMPLTAGNAASIQGMAVSGSKAEGSDPQDYKYDVALSFAGNERHLAEQLALELREAGLRVFYDRFEEHELWGQDLAIRLQRVYEHEARYCVIFKSQAYLDRMWTNHERQSAVARMIRDRGQGYVLPIEIEPVQLPGVPHTVVYQSLKNRTISDIAKMLIKKLGNG